MDRLHSYSFPGLIFLVAQLTYRFVPYGFYIVMFVLTALVFWGTVRMIYYLSQMLTRSR